MKRIVLIASFLLVASIGAFAQKKVVKIMGYPATVSSQGTILCGADQSKLCIQIIIGRTNNSISTNQENEIVEEDSFLETETFINKDMFMYIFTNKDYPIELPIKGYKVLKNSKNQTEVIVE